MINERSLIFVPQKWELRIWPTNNNVNVILRRNLILHAKVIYRAGPLLGKRGNVNGIDADISLRPHNELIPNAIAKPDDLALAMGYLDYVKMFENVETRQKFGPCIDGFINVGEIGFNWILEAIKTGCHEDFIIGVAGISSGVRLDNSDDTWDVESNERLVILDWRFRNSYSGSPSEPG